MFFRSARQRLEKAMEDFRRERDALAEQFLETAARTGRPRGLRWLSCTLIGEPSFARDPASGRLQALVAMEVRFEAVEGGGMEEVEAVGNVRAATAVFHYKEDQWTTDGRTVFNLDPAQTIQHFRLEPISPP